MIFNCENCGISISSKKTSCPYCKKNNNEYLEVLSESAPHRENAQWRERMKGTILSYVLRQT